MSDRDRTAYAAIVSVVGASMAIGGFLLLGVGGVLAIFGATLLVLGAMALVQAVAAGLGLFTPRSREDDDDTRR
jgi:hypothetical protein